MTAKEYLELINAGENQQLTFLIGRAVKDDNTPFYHLEYRDTPIYCVWEWEQSKSGAYHQYCLINEAQPPIDAGSGWGGRYRRKDFMCFLVIPREDLELIYSAKQAAEFIEHRAADIRKRIK